MFKFLRIKKENEVLKNIIFEIIKILLSNVDSNQKILKIKNVIYSSDQTK